MYKFLAFVLILCTITSAFSQALSKQSPLGTSESIQINPDGWYYKNCGTPEDSVFIHSIKVSPDPPKPGENLTVTVEGTAVDLIEEGAHVDVSVKYGYIKLINKKFDICEEARKHDAELLCPVDPGSYLIQHTVALPSQIPYGRYTINVNGYTVDDDNLLCLVIWVDFSKFPFFKD